MKISKKISLLFLAFILASCKKQTTNEDIVIVEALNKGDFGYILPYQNSSTSVIHSKYGNNMQDIYSMGEGALKLAKKYFDVNSVYASEGSVLEASELERFDSSYRGLGLLKYKTDFNPEGLNPEKGTYVEYAGVQMYNPILVSDVHEIDFRNSNGELVGFQFTIVLNSNVSYYEALKDESGNVQTDEDGNPILSENSKTMTVSDELLYNYGSVGAGLRLVNYLQNNHPEVGNLPIHVLLYKAAPSDSMTTGTFIGQSYVKSASSTYERIYQEWVFAPSDRLENLNNVLATQIASVKSSVFKTFPNEVGFFGRVFFENEMPTIVEIEINMRGKTYVEIQSLIQYMVTLAPNINENNPELKIHVLSESETVALIHRAADSNDISIHLN